MTGLYYVSDTVKQCVTVQGGCHSYDPTPYVAVGSKGDFQRNDKDSSAKTEGSRSATSDGGDSDCCGDRFDQGHMPIIQEVSGQAGPFPKHTFPWRGLKSGILL